jgi:hypothetical protein
MTIHWLLRVGDGENFINSSKYKIWGINSTSSFGKYFIKNIKEGDILWFVKSKSHGKIIAVATYVSQNMRQLGPLIDISLTNDELGWSGNGVDLKCDTEIHYSNLYGLLECDILTNIKGITSIRKYDEKIELNLPDEYQKIVKYSKITTKLL